MTSRSSRLLAVAAAFGFLISLTLPTQAAASIQPIPASKSGSIAEKIAASKALLDINTATAAQLTALPGMGAAYAQRVIAGRPYSAKNQLVQRGVLPQSQYEKIKDLIIAHRVKK